MSIAAERSIPVERRKRYAAAAFVTLLILSVFWPSPIVSANRLWIGEELPVDELSFLGREAPSWDVVFWCLAGLLLLAVMQSAEAIDFRPSMAQYRALRLRGIPWRRVAGGFLLGLLATGFAWVWCDAPIVAWAERIQSDAIEDVIRLMNRLGGGMNPVMIVVFFLVAGTAYREGRWVSHAIAMAISGLAAGIAAQVVKHLVGRARPELWLGTAHYAPGSSTSFPSGHTVGAFALAGVLVFSARSRVLRVVAFLLASAVGLSRILAFRHWSSDVTASAAIGLLTAWIVVRIVSRAESPALPEQVDASRAEVVREV